MKIARWMLVVLFLIFLGGVSVAGLVQEDREKSENENRYLAQVPQISWERVKSGRFQKDFEEYLNDQIAARDLWITAKTAVQKAARNTDIGGAYVGKDGYDFEKITPEDVDEKQVQRNLVAIQDFFSTVGQKLPKERLSFLLIPTSGYVLSEKLPAGARLFDQNSYIERAGNSVGEGIFVDVREELRSHKDESIYYHTDHHWTTDGAYIAYEKWSKSKGHHFVDRTELTKRIVSENFRGSLYSKILDADSVYDEIWVYEKKGETPAIDTQYRVTIDGKKEGTLFDFTKLSEKDQYKFFLGDNYGQVCIENTGTVTGGGNLLVIKDSFANTFVPLIVEEFDRTYMLDLRYYNGDVQQYIKEHEITEVLVLYNISNFISDRNLYKLNGI